MELPGGKPGIGFDDLRFAPKLGKVLAPGGRAGKLYLIDPKTREVTSVDGFSATDDYSGGHDDGPTSADEGRDHIFVTDRSAVVIDVVDSKSLAIVSKTALQGHPDYIRWVEPKAELWVTEPGNEALEIFSVPDDANAKPLHATTVSVPGGPESLVIDAKRNRAYAHLWEGATVALDLDSRAIVAQWPNTCDESRGIALDEERGFVFVGCNEGKAVTLDVDHGGAVLSTLEVGDGVDVISYDPGRRHLYVPGGDSETMSIVEVSASGQLTELRTVATADDAHCVTVDDQGNAWVCDPDEGRLLVTKDTY